MKDMVLVLQLLNLKTIDFCYIPGSKHQFFTVTSSLAGGEPMVEFFPYNKK